MNFRGAVEYPLDAAVAVVPLDRRVLAVAHSTEELHGPVSDPPQRFGGYESGFT
jgi:hypothetical protein